MKRNLFLTTALVFIACVHAIADPITLQGGHAATGTVLQTNFNENTILLLRDYGTADYYMPIVTEIKIESQGSVVVTPNTNRTPNWKHIVLNLSKQPLAQNLKQIPATVIDKGILRNVPYVSFRGGEDYEVNIYGDLDNPAGFEVGVYRKLLVDGAAKENCLQFVESLLYDSADKETLGKLKREKDGATRNGLTFEITPPTDEDAYLGWWISIYDENRLDLARASESELERISTAKTPTTPKPTTTQENRGWSAEEMKLARPVQTYQTPSYPARSTYNPPRPAAPSTTYNSRGSSPSPTYTGGRVYVRGYTRKDGTYVQPHTRSAPRRR
jgi:hypothetical protein